MAENKTCEAFSMEDPKKACAHLQSDHEVVKNYGDMANDHPLHTWDDGCRILARCNRCGGYFLIQKSEFHGVGNDDYYVDYFPVDSEEQAEELNQKYNGFEAESNFPGRYLKTDPGREPHWSK